MPDSPLSSSITVSNGTLAGDHETGLAPSPRPIDIDTLNTILERREGQLVDRILSHLATHHTTQTPLVGHSSANHRQPINLPQHQSSEIGDGAAEMHSMHSSHPAHHDESASAVMDLVEILFPGVERGTLTQIIVNRFKPTNIYRLLASEKDRAESQQVISIGGVSFEQGEREGKESEYRMGPFFKAWAAYCGILTKLAPLGLQGDLAR